MNKPVLLLTLAALGLCLLGIAFFLRRPEPVVVPPPPPKVTPIVPPGTPVIPPVVRPAPPPGDPLLQRWRTAVLQRSQKDVLDVQSTFLSREGDYREPLMALSRDDADPRVRAFSVAVLGRMKAPPAEEFFLERTGDAHEYPRTSALEALEKRGTAACLAAVDRLAAQDPVESVRAVAARAAKAVRSR